METNSSLHETVLADFHVAHGARMVPFAGWNMPVQYADGIKAEHLATRNAAGLFDVCLLYTSPSPRVRQKSRMPSSA